MHQSLTHKNLMHRSRLKYQGKRVLSRTGLRLRIGGPARTDLLAALRQLQARGVRPATVVDVGVADGTYELYDTFPAAHHLLLEPMQEFESALRAICSTYDAEYVLAAADADDGQIVVAAPADAHATSLLDVGADGGRVLPTVTLDGVIAERGLPGPFVIKIDVQGAELRVLRGAETTLASTAALVLETSLFPFSTDTPLLHEVIARLAAYGFVPYDVFNGVTRPLDGALGQIDVLFVPVDSPLRADPRFASDEQRAADEQRLVWRLRRRLGV